ncbi:MAG: sodium:solute symporter family protein [Flavobacteriales bacterium]
MLLSSSDLFIIAAYLVIALLISFYFKKKGSKSLADFFTGGRSMPWYIAGVSMVATTFAADTPLAVTELVAKNGISGNWLWWNMLIGGMLTTFFFARLWRRAGVNTELELIELRYGGKPAALLRGFKAVYLGLFMNCLIIGWVNLALVDILKVFFGVPAADVYWYVAAAMLFTSFYSSLSGIWGVAVTDALQFIIAMIGCIVLAFLVLNSEQVGGMSGLVTQLPDWSLSFFPQIGEANASQGALSITIGAFFAFLGVQWWASWYPGAEPGGGGYVVQRMLSTRSERDSILATLFFQVAHYALRPWPWIIVALCSLVLYPELTGGDQKLGYVYAMRDYLPNGLRGLLLVAFLAAYMSTISTQLNWGASYLMNDFYVRFFRKSDNDSSNEQNNLVNVSRLIMFLLMAIGLFATTRMTSISGVWEFIIECGAGLGLVLILRWFWWRINAWSEIVATFAPFVGYAIGHFYLEKLFGQGFIGNKGSFLFTVLFTTLSWLIVTMLTSPENDVVLRNFYQRIQPAGNWKRFSQGTASKMQVSYLLLSWFLAVLFTYSCLFFIGKLVFMQWNQAITWAALMLLAFFSLMRITAKTSIFK